jgi:ribonuclease P protein component
LNSSAPPVAETIQAEDIGFGRRHRVLTAAQFAEVFAARKVLRGVRFALHYRPNGLPGARLGLAIPKKQARTAVLRNAIKRQAREVFRHRRALLPCADLVLRLGGPVGTHDKAARLAWREEIAMLLGQFADKMKAAR